MHEVIIAFGKKITEITKDFLLSFLRFGCHVKEAKKRGEVVDRCLKEARFRGLE